MGRRVQVVEHVRDDFVGGEEDVVAARRVGVTQQLHEVQALAVDPSQLPPSPGDAPAVAERDEHRRQIDARGHLPARRLHLLGEPVGEVGDDQREVDRFLVRAPDLARQQPVRPGVFAVVGREHDHGVGPHPPRDRAYDVSDLVIDHLLHERVHVEPALPVAVRRDPRPVGLRLDRRGLHREGRGAGVVGRAAPDRLLEGTEHLLGVRLAVRGQIGVRLPVRRDRRKPQRLGVLLARHRAVHRPRIERHQRLVGEYGVILVGLGPGPEKLPVVRVHEADGEQKGAALRAFCSSQVTAASPITGTSLFAPWPL